MRIIDYINETRSELNHVSWPTRQQAVNFTTLVIVLSILAGLYLGLFDFLFTTMLKNII